jgi:chromatin structure-remodeling complex subunit RSC1/2
MAVTDAQKAAVEQLIQTIKSVSSPRKKRVLADLFLELVDKEAWANYYQVTTSTTTLSIRTLNHVQ